MTLSASDNANLLRIFALQSAHQHTVKATTADDRIAKLLRLKEALMTHRDAIADALHADLRRARVGAPEVGAVLAEIEHTVAHLGQWMQPVDVLPSLPIPGAAARIIYEPRGVCAVFGPWNFPVLLVLQPLVPLIAAGNCAIVKPNELTPASSRIVARIIRETFDEAEIAAVEGGVELATAMQDLPFDHVFFTGSPAVGKHVMASAARHLTSVTLELGGKCPVIIDDTVDLEAVARKVAMGRCTNAGQLCLAADHVWIPASLREPFVEHLASAFRALFYKNGQLDKTAFGRIVDQRNLARIERALDDAVSRGASIRFGGEIDREDLTVHPTVLTDVPLDALLMREEIFGPVLPVMTYGDESEIWATIRAGGKPLAIYIFSRDEERIARQLQNTSSGGVTINDILLHAMDPVLPFGGVNGSGMGRYHGIHGFKEMSHERAVFTVKA